jgi:hypothetical protein
LFETRGALERKEGREAGRAIVAVRGAPSQIESGHIILDYP